MSHQTSEEWWESVVKEIQKHPELLPLLSDEAFQRAVDAIDPADCQPLSEEAIQRILKRVKEA